MADTELFAYWLVPEKYTAGHLRRLIGELAREQDSVAFGPHITLFAGREDSDEVLRQRMAKMATAQAGPVDVEVKGYAHGKDYFKCLYLDLEANDAMKAMVAEAKRLDRESGYRFAPHLSLMYKELDSRKRRKLMDALEPPPDAIRCSQLAVVRPARGRQDWTDIHAWRIIAMRDLT